MFETVEGSIIAAIGLLVFALILTLLITFIYSGLLKSINVAAGAAPISAVTMAYKYHKGPYNTSWKSFTEALNLAPNCRTIGIYYDDPKLVPESELRFVVGTLITDEPTETCKAVKDRVVLDGYQLTNLPNISYAVTSTFPYRTFLSIYIAIARVYPQLESFIKYHNLCAHPFIEIYDSTTIHYMAPLVRQEEFYVKEVSPALSVKSDSTAMSGSSAESQSSVSTQESAEDEKPEPAVTVSAVSSATTSYSGTPNPIAMNVPQAATKTPSKESKQSIRSDGMPHPQPIIKLPSSELASVSQEESSKASVDEPSQDQLSQEELSKGSEKNSSDSSGSSFEQVDVDN